MATLASYRMLSKADASQILLSAKQKAGLTFKALAEKLQVNKVWLTAAIHGEHPLSRDLAIRLLEELQITVSAEEQAALVAVLVQLPTARGNSNTGKDPAIRRLQELVDLNANSITALIREEAGDGIMSAIDCTLQLEKVVVPNETGAEETRIVVKIDGKFLPYKVDHGKK